MDFLSVHLTFGDYICRKCRFELLKNTFLRSFFNHFFSSKKAPEPAESWSPSIRDAFEHSAICIQPRMYTEPFIKSEDCLTLNIYVPSGKMTFDQTFKKPHKN